eukprot:350933-Chlamydomonas_euryale.AAC.3
MARANAFGQRNTAETAWQRHCQLPEGKGLGLVGRQGEACAWMCRGICGTPCCCGCAWQGRAAQAISATADEEGAREATIRRQGKDFLGRAVGVEGWQEERRGRPAPATAAPIFAQ